MSYFSPFHLLEDTAFGRPTSYVSAMENMRDLVALNKDRNTYNPDHYIEEDYIEHWAYDWEKVLLQLEDHPEFQYQLYEQKALLESVEQENFNRFLSMRVEIIGLENPAFKAWLEPMVIKGMTRTLINGYEHMSGATATLWRNMRNGGFVLPEDWMPKIFTPLRERWISDIRDYQLTVKSPFEKDAKKTLRDTIHNIFSEYRWEAIQQFPLPFFQEIVQRYGLLAEDCYKHINQVTKPAQLDYSAKETFQRIIQFYLLYDPKNSQFLQLESQLKISPVSKQEAKTSLLGDGLKFLLQIVLFIAGAASMYSTCQRDEQNAVNRQVNLAKEAPYSRAENGILGEWMGVDSTDVGQSLINRQIELMEKGKGTLTYIYKDPKNGQGVFLHRPFRWSLSHMEGRSTDTMYLQQIYEPTERLIRNGLPKDSLPSALQSIEESLAKAMNFRLEKIWIPKEKDKLDTIYLNDRPYLKISN